MKEIDIKIAPKGYYAAPEQFEGTCIGCAFDNQTLGSCLRRPCLGHERKDGESVIFLPLEGPVPLETNPQGDVASLIAIARRLLEASESKDISVSEFLRRDGVNLRQLLREIEGKA